jgi:phosphoribosyl-ATP pyrophosphohydrolase/phosphoribosyl-AMP cyclohydrolase
MHNNEVEKIIQNLNFNEKGLIPAIIQDTKGNVLMLGYMNKISLEKTLKTKKVWFYSRKRNKLWQKGETSGNYQILKELYYDCDKDALLIKVEQIGVACHTGNYTCFFERII